VPNPFAAIFLTPFGKVHYKSELEPLLYQKVGKVETLNPLLVIKETDQKKLAILLGEGIWRWRLHEYAKKEENLTFNELFSKLIQFLSSKEDKRKFKVYPINNEVSTLEGVNFETEMYNDLYERVYGNKVDLYITDELNNKVQYTYVPSEGNTKYKVSNLTEGVYVYRALTEYNGKKEQVRGEFLIKELQLESINLTADFNLLRKLAESSNGNFYKATELNLLKNKLDQLSYPGIIHSNETYLSLINLKIIFFIFLLIISIEWFTRKFNGAY